MDNHITAERIADILTSKNIAFEQKRMFGGECFMVDDKICLGTYKNGVIARVGPEAAERLGESIGVGQMTSGSRPMVGYLFIESPGYENDSDLNFWVEKCLAWNPKAKASKRKRKRLV